MNWVISQCRTCFFVAPLIWTAKTWAISQMLHKQGDLKKKKKSPLPTFLFSHAAGFICHKKAFSAKDRLYLPRKHNWWGIMGDFPASASVSLSEQTKRIDFIQTKVETLLHLNTWTRSQIGFPSLHTCSQVHSKHRCINLPAVWTEFRRQWFLNMPFNVTLVMFVWFFF